MTVQAVCPLLVGRDEELTELYDSSGGGVLTFIAGEAGVGKSRLGREATRHAKALGIPSLVGACRDEAKAPYTPLVAAVRRHARTLDADALAALFDGPASLAGTLVPELADLTTSARAPTPGAGTATQADLFSSIWHLLRRISGEGRQPGSLLLLEDLHWADADTLRLVDFLARESEGLGAWIVGTFRSDELHRRHPLTRVVSDLTRERLARRIDLQPLSPEGVRTMVSAIFDGTSVGDEFLAALVTRTGGNPFFTEELLRDLLESGAIYRRGGDWQRADLSEIHMPQSVRDALLGRITQLGEAAVSVLQFAAVIGERIDEAVLAEASGADLGDVEAVIAAGIRMQILAERGDGGRPVYTFRHALTREALAEDLVGPERRRVHRRIAEALVSVHGGDLDSVAAEVAAHHRQAGDVDAAIEMGLRAARRAVRAVAPSEATQHYDAVLSLLSRSDPRRAPVLLEVAEAMVRHDQDSARSRATEALDSAGPDGDPEGRARALVVIAQTDWAAGDSQRALDRVAEALDLARRTGGPVELDAMAALARSLTLGDQHLRAEELIDRGIPLATAAGHDVALSRLYGSRMMLVSDGTPAFEEAFSQSVAAARRAGSGYQECINIMNAGYISLWSGRLTRSEELLRDGVRAAERYMPSDRYARAGLAWLLSLTGDLSGARNLAESVLGGTGGADIPSRIVALTGLCEVALRTGDPRAAELIDELSTAAARTGEAQRSVPALAARARLGAQRGGSEADELFWLALSNTNTNAGTGSHWPFSPDYARYLAADDRAADLAEWLSAIHRLSEADPTPHNLAAEALCAGISMLVDRAFTAAVGQLTAARIAYRDMPCPAREVECLLALSDASWRGDRPAEALAAAEEAKAIAERIGAAVLAAEAEALRSRAATPAVLATVLFTDVVDSTATMAALGDRAWKTLIERHNSIVRGELRRWGGRELDTAGDGFCAAFDSPAAAIRCALAARDALQQIGVPIRAGVHTGECQVSGPKLAGVAVSIAARISSIATAGEVLASGTVQELVAGSSLQFEDRGLHELKGVPGRWRVAAASDR